MTMNNFDRFNNISNPALAGWSRTPVEKICDNCGSKFNAYNTKRKVCDGCLQGRSITPMTAPPKPIGVVGLTPNWQNTSFETSNNKINTKHFKIAMDYSKQYHRGQNSIIFYSNKAGAGKTHLAICIAKEVGKKQRVLFQTARDLIMDIYNSLVRDYSDEDYQSERDIFQKILSYDLVVLDDLGWDRPTERIFNIYWTLFDKLMTHNIPIIATTNKCPTNDKTDQHLELRIGPAAYSRLRKMAQGAAYHLEEKDLRRINNV